MSDGNEQLRKNADVIISDSSKNGFIRIRYHWSENPKKTQEWYIEQCRELDDKRKVNQELDLIFVGTSNCIFEDDLLSRFKSKIHIDTFNCPYETQLIIYEKDLNPNDYYLIGVDTARSLSGDSAYNSIEVYSFSQFKQIAEFNYRIGSFTKYGQIIDAIFRWLFAQVSHNIIIAIENNTIGLASIEHLLNHVHDINYTNYLYKEAKSKEWGIYTSGISKDLMIGCFTEIIKDNPEAIASQPLINQLSAIERSRGGNISSDTFSDLFMASCFCAYARKMKSLEILPLIALGTEVVQQNKIDTYKQFINLNTNIININENQPNVYNDEEIDQLTILELERRNNQYSNNDDRIDEFFSPFCN